MTIGGKQFIFLGPQGSGKGTQAKIFAQKLGVPHISTGDVFRDNIGRQTELGQKIDGILKSGQLVPDDITNQLIKARLSQSDAATGFILDGYPRNLAQADFLFNLKPEAIAVCIDLTDEEAVKRISGRRMSLATGAIYHLDFNPPPANLPPDDLIQRPDDTEVAVRQRLNIYHLETEPLLEFYRSKQKLITVDGSPPIEAVTDELIKVLLP